MKSETVLIFICIISLSWINPCKSEDIYGKADTPTFQGNIVNIQISIHNNDDKEIYIPLTHWIFSGDTIADLLIGPYQTYFVNKISYYKSKYDTLQSIIDAGFSKDFLTSIPSFLEVKPKDSGLIKIKIQLTPALYERFNQESFYLNFNIAYGETELLSEIGEIINCEGILNYPVADLPEIFINLETRSEICYKFNDMMNCHLDKKQSEIFALGFLKRINFKVNLP